MIASANSYAGQQDLAGAHQVCLAHVLRDVQYAIDCGDTIFAPTIRDHLRWAIGVGRRRHNLKDSALVSYAAKADLKTQPFTASPLSACHTKRQRASASSAEPSKANHPAKSGDA